jgi:DNA ligase-1
LKKMDKKKLYTIDSAGRTRVWECWVGTKENVHGIFYTDGLIDGKMKDPTFREAKEKNVGKANYLSPEKQAQEMLEQEAGKKLRSNYFENIELALSNKQWLPMLAHKYHDHVSKLSFPRFSQPKLDGARCNIYWSELEKKVVAKTRTGKEYFTSIHIIEELVEFCTANKHLILDGELYNHTYKHNFEEIMSLARQSKPTKEDLAKSASLLEYHIYDIYDKQFPDTPFVSRINHLKNLADMYDFKMVKFISTSIVANQTEEDKLHDQYLEEGYEGQMIRVFNSVYKVDGRSNELLKRKVFIDAEFPIIDIQEGEANWKGCAKRVIVKLPNGKECGCGIDGSYEINRERFENKQNYIGKLATVRYFRETIDGMLYIPVVKDINRHD